MVNKKLDKQDVDFIIRKAGEGFGVSEIQKILLEERQVDISSRQTIYNALKKAKKSRSTPAQQAKKPEPETLKTPISREEKPRVDKPKPEVVKPSNSESSTESNRKGSNFEKVSLVSISSIYKKFLAYCKENQHTDDIVKTILRHATNKKKSYRRIIMDSIDIFLRMVKEGEIQW